MNFNGTWTHRTRLISKWLKPALVMPLPRKQAEIIASLDQSHDHDDLRDILEPKHVIQAAEYLSQFLVDAKQAAQHNAIFLSYSTKDEDFARELEGELRKESVRCFLAPLSIKPGECWPQEIWQAIRTCRVFVLVVTTEAIRSKWCLLEIGAALGLHKQIVAVLRHSTKLPDVLKTVQAMKVQTKKQQADLVEYLKKSCSS